MQSSFVEPLAIFGHGQGDAVGFEFSASVSHFNDGELLWLVSLVGNGRGRAMYGCDMIS